MDGDFAIPLPLRVMSELVGLPKDYDRLKAWSDAGVHHRWNRDRRRPLATRISRAGISGLFKAIH